MHSPAITKLSEAKIRLVRVAKRLIWPHPLLYYPYGILRKRGNSLNTDFEFYMGGYPRSANTFSQVAFMSANPKTKILTHRHVPTFVLNLTRNGIPGLVLIRKPLDAAVSAAIYNGRSLEAAVAYWNDYYETLLPIRSELFLARFEDVTHDFGAVMRALNDRWGTSFVPFEHTPENASRCFQATEDICRGQYGAVIESRVCRPSEQRRDAKHRRLQLDQSPFLRNELARAQELYDIFLGNSVALPREASSVRRAPAPPAGRAFEATSVGA
jgi:hypothetical protein